MMVSLPILSEHYTKKNAGALFTANVTQCMWELWYKSCDADPELLMKPEFRQEDK